MISGKLVLAEAKKRVLDSLACFYGAFDEKPVRVLRQTFSKDGGIGCQLWGTSQKISPEMAAWLNGTAVRALDYNDTYLSKEPCHPSDLISSFWAACEISGRPHQGKLLMEAIARGYEVLCRLCDTASLRERGWDHVTYLPIASAVGCSGILGLTPEQTEHAISLSLVGNIALRQTRVGTISDWKAACAAYAARSGLWAARLAKNGFTGPSDIFTGRHGFIPQVLGRRQGVRSPFSINGKWRPDPLSRTHMKFFPAEHHAQSAIEAAIQIHQRIRFRPEAVQSLTIQCFKVAVDIIGSEAEKWNPTTRETADHSLPYLVAAALLDGHITLEQFHKKRYLDPDVKILLKKIRVVDSKRYSRLYPKWMPSRVIIRFKDGSQVSEEVLRPKGYAGHPMTEQDVQEKFFRLAKNHLSENRMRKLVHKIKNLDRVDKLSSLVPLMRI